MREDQGEIGRSLWDLGKGRKKNFFLSGNELEKGEVSSNTGGVESVNDRENQLPPTYPSQPLEKGDLTLSLILKRLEREGGGYKFLVSVVSLFPPPPPSDVRNVSFGGFRPFKIRRLSFGFALLLLPCYSRNFFQRRP